MKYLPILLLILLSSCCKDHLEDCPCYDTEFQHPHYKGCPDGTVYNENNDCALPGMYAHLYNVIRYPAAAREDSIQGIVAINFDIFEDGSLGNFSAINDTLGYGLAEEALRAVKTLNDKGFCPARESCEAVVFNYTLPIRFILF